MGTAQCVSCAYSLPAMAVHREDPRRADRATGTDRLPHLRPSWLSNHHLQRPPADSLAVRHGDVVPRSGLPAR